MLNVYLLEVEQTRISHLEKGSTPSSQIKKGTPPTKKTIPNPNPNLCVINMWQISLYSVKVWGDRVCQKKKDTTILFEGWMSLYGISIANL